MTTTDDPKPRRPPAGLAAGGRALWRDLTAEHPVMDSRQLVQLTEACRLKDRLDRLDLILRGDADTWARLVLHESMEEYDLKIDGALLAANATANLLKQLLVALRLPDEVTGKLPQRRGPRVQKPSVPGGAGKPVSSLERARQRRSS